MGIEAFFGWVRQASWWQKGVPDSLRPDDLAVSNERGS